MVYPDNDVPLAAFYPGTESSFIRVPASFFLGYKSQAVAHEFGHYVATENGFAAGGANHYPGFNVRYFRYEADRPAWGSGDLHALAPVDEQSAFQEGWADYFGAVASSSTVLEVGAGPRRSSWPLNQPLVLQGRGEDDELSVARVLYALATDSRYGVLDPVWQQPSPRGVFTLLKSGTALVPGPIKQFNHLWAAITPTLPTADTRCNVFGALLEDNGISPVAVSAGWDAMRQREVFTFQVPLLRNNPLPGQRVRTPDEVRAFASVDFVFYGASDATLPIKTINVPLPAPGGPGAGSAPTTPDGRFQIWRYVMPSATWDEIKRDVPLGAPTVLWSVGGVCPLNGATRYFGRFTTAPIQARAKSKAFHGDRNANTLVFDYDLQVPGGEYPGSIEPFTIDVCASVAGSFDDPNLSGSLLSFPVTGSALTASDEADSHKTLLIPVDSQAYPFGLAGYEAGLDSNHLDAGDYYLMARIHRSDQPIGTNDILVRFQGGVFQTSDGQVRVFGASSLDTLGPEDNVTDTVSIVTHGDPRSVDVSWAASTTPPTQVAKSFALPTNLIGAVRGMTYGGNDQVSVAGDTYNVGVTAFGGEGNDLLQDARTYDYLTAPWSLLDGGPGVDTLLGGLGPDVLRGDWCDEVTAGSLWNRLDLEYWPCDSPFSPAGIYTGAPPVPPATGNPLAVGVDGPPAQGVGLGPPSVAVPGYPSVPYSNVSSAYLQWISGTVYVVGNQAILRGPEGFPSGGNVVVLRGGTLDLGGASLTAGTVMLVDGSIVNGTISATAFDVRKGTISANLAGIGGLTKTTDDDVVLSGTNTFTGGVQVSGGTLQAGSANAFPANTYLAVTGAVVDLHGWSPTIATLEGDGTITNQGAATATLTLVESEYSYFEGAIVDGAGLVRLVKTGSGRLDLAGYGMFTGGTLLAEGSMLVTTDSLCGDVENNASLVFSQDGYGFFAGDISGSGTVTISAGAVQLLGNNSYPSTTVSSGAALVGDTDSLTGNVLNNGALLFEQGIDGAFAGAITGTGTVTKAGDGELGFTGSGSSCTDTMRIDAGAVLVYDGTQLGDASAPLVFMGTAILRAGAALDLDAGRTVSIPFAETTVTFDTQEFDVIVPCDIGGEGALRKLGSGTLFVSGSNTYAGGTEVAEGGLEVDSACGLPQGGDLVIAAGAQITLAIGLIEAADSQNADMGSGQLGDETQDMDNGGGSLTDDPESGPGLTYWLKPVAGGTGDYTVSGSYVGGGDPQDAYSVTIHSLPTGTATIKFHLYASLQGGNSAAADDGFAAGLLDILQQAGETPLGGQVDPVGLAFGGLGSSGGVTNLDGSLGGPLWTASLPATNGAWVRPFSPVPVFGTEVNANGYSDILLGEFTYTFSSVGVDDGAAASLGTAAVTYTGGGAGRYAQMWSTDGTPQRENAGENVGAGPAVTLVVALGSQGMIAGAATEGATAGAVANADVGDADPNVAATVSGDARTETATAATTNEAAAHDAAIAAGYPETVLLDPSWLGLVGQAVTHARSLGKGAAASAAIDEVLARYGL